MLNNKNVQAFFWIMLAVLLVINWQMQLPIYVFVILLFAYLSVTFYGSYFIQANFFIRSHNFGNKNKKQVALTFDDGPNTEYTPLLLDILKEENVPALFFLIGKNIDKNEELVKRMDAEGHIVGNHSFSHNYWFSMKKQSDMLRDIQNCDQAIENVIHRKPRLFRPPYGVTNPMVAKSITMGNYESVGWNLRTYDTMSKSGAQLLNKVVKQVKNGDIILLHDHGKYTVTVLADIIKKIKNQGFDIVRADVLLGVNAYH